MSGYSSILPILKKISLSSYPELPVNARKGIQGAVGAGLGGALGDFLNDDEEDPSSTIGGALLGGALGAATAHGNYQQLKPVTEWVEKQLPEMLSKGKPTPSPIPTWDRGVAAAADQFTPLKNLPGIEEATKAQFDISYGGGAGKADALLAAPSAAVKRLRDLGLQDQLREYMTLNTGRRAWENLQGKQATYASQVREAMIMGDTAAENQARRAYADLQEKLNANKVTFDDASVAKLKGYQDQFRGALGEDYNHIEEAANSIYDTQAEVRKRLLSEGLIDKATHDRYELEHNIVPFSPGYRSMLEKGADGEFYVTPQSREYLQRSGLSLKSTDNIIQKLEGSSKSYADPLESSFFHIQESVKDIERNRAAKTFVKNAMEVADESGQLPGSGFYIRPKAEGETLHPGEGVISYFEGGKKQDFAVPIEFADVMNLANANDVAKGFQVMSKMQRWASRLITSGNIAFAMANAPKDVAEAVIYTPVWKNPIEFGKAWWSSLKEIVAEDFYQAPQSEARRAFREDGASHSTLNRNIQEAPAWQRVIGHDDLSPLGKASSLFQDILNVGEESTKLATHRTLKQQQARGSGAQDWEIASQVRRFGGSPDFARRGNLTKQASQLYMFLNPTVQGLSRFYEKGAKDPAWLIKSMGALSMGLLVADRLNRLAVNPETGRPWIEELDPQERRSNLIIMLGGSEVTSQGRTRPQYLKIPLAHATIALLSPAQDALMNANGEQNAPGLGQGIANAVSPLLPITGTLDADNLPASAAANVVSSLNPLIREPIEQLANVSAFNGVPIVGQRLQKLEPSAQFTDTTSPTMVKAAQLPIIRDIPMLNSPQRLEHAWRSFFPGAAEVPLSLIDARKPKVAQGQQEFFSRFPGLGPIVRRFLPSGQDGRRDALADDVYGRAGEAADATATFNSKVTPEEKSAYLQENRPLLMENRALSPFVRQLGALGAQRRRIVADQSLSPEQRRDALQRLYNLQLQLLKGAQDRIISLDSQGAPQ